MSPKSSTFVSETREREAWISGTADAAEAPGLLAAAALVRGTLEAIPIPDEAEERSRAIAVAHMEQLRRERAGSGPVQAPWFLRLGNAMRFVFTFWRRR